MIRKYAGKDRDEVLEVWAAASAVAHPFLGEEFLRKEREEIRTVHLLRAETWVWEAGGRVVGFIALLGDEVGAVFVDPGCQRSGIGRALMDHARDLRGELQVEVFKANAIGRAFYEKYGFEPVSRGVHEPTGFEVLRLRLRAGRARGPEGSAEPAPEGGRPGRSGRTGGGTMPRGTRRLLVSCLFVAQALLAGGTIEAKETAEFGAAIIGSWKGEGEVFGRPVKLTRVWSRELAGRFLLADMKVEMANGGTFRALAYWSGPEEGRYQVTWLDELGERQLLEGLGNEEGSEVVIHQLAENHDGPPEWRRVVYRIVGENRYTETLFAEREGKWKPVGEFRFTRDSSSQ